MTTFLWIIIFSLLGGVLSVLAAAWFLLLPDRFRERAIPHFVSFAIGALLGAAFLALLPHAVVGADALEVHQLGLTLVVGILTFFVLEKLVLWRHCHHEECEAHGPADTHRHSAAATLILVGDGIHNFVDGVLIAAAFLVDLHLGVITAVAVAAHEIPQELGDFAVLLQGGLSRARALLYNVISSFTTVLGAVLAYFSLVEVTRILPFVLAVAASSFIYIAVADLIPGLHKRLQLAVTLQQLLLIAAGVSVIYLTHSTLH